MAYPFPPSSIRGSPPVNKAGKKISLGSGRIVLKRSENAWKAHSLTPEAIAENDKMHRQIAGDLNKITPEKFDTIFKRLRETLCKLPPTGLEFFANELLVRVSVA
jgi:hypothetical protein